MLDATTTHIYSLPFQSWRRQGVRRSFATAPLGSHPMLKVHRYLSLLALKNKNPILLLIESHCLVSQGKLVSLLPKSADWNGQIGSE